jgi:cell wall-associated NlpC family hydrolase
MANVKFIRVGGDAPPATPPLTPAAPAAPAGGGGAADVAAAAADTASGANPYPGDDASKAQLAAWMGREAEKRGLPKQLPVMASLVESGVKNLSFGDADSVGFFQMRVGIWNQGAYKGFPEKPELQVKWFLDQAEAVKKQRLAAGKSVTDANQFGDWIADVERPAEQFRGRYGQRLGEANGLLGQASAAPAPAAAAAAAPAPGAPVAAAAAAPAPPKAGQSGQFMAATADAASVKKGASGSFMAVKPVGPASALAPPGTVPAAVDAAAAAAPGSGSSTLGAAALKTAESQLGVKEEGTNTGAKVDEYLKAAGVGPGNPWCASFVTWALAQNGHKMDGSGWAAVQTWVRNAEAGKNDLRVVSADQARPGDIVTYDWGGQEDFGSDGHIGFLKSEVKDGKFTALEGNNHDAVMEVPRQTGDANIKFIRIGGDAPPPAGAAAPQAPGGASVADAALGAVGSGGASGYPGDNAPKEQLAAWLGREAEKRGLPKQLPVMASLVESGVKNLNYGDADSVGFFQMRVGIWNQGAYKGFPEKPELQAKWFLDQAEAVKKQRIARGQSVTDPKQFGDWIADIERPAEQYRGRYGMRLGEANALLAKAGDAPPAPGAPAAPVAAVADAAASAAGGGGGGAGPQALAALKEAQKYTGTAYRYGGSTPQTGFDCSGLVQWAYAKAGIQIPRVTDAQFAAGNGSPVDRENLKPGDLIFFGKPGNIYHVAISMGGDKFLHAPKTGDVVKVASLKDSYFSQNFAGGRRFDHAAPVAEAAAAAPAVDPKAVAEAQAAVARDAAEVKRTNSGLFMAVKAQEERRHRTVQFMKAIDPKEAQAAAAPPAAAPPADASAAVAPPAAVEPPAADPARAADAGPPIQLPTDISDDYPGNSASKAEMAKWLAKQADKHGLPPELPVMASLVESGVKNLNFGDADSVGFFQMRIGIWNQGDYKGFPEHPELQAKWFIDQALAVKKQAIARGDADFGKDPSKWGEWIADIERPAEQYRGRYQLRLKEARGLLG